MALNEFDEHCIKIYAFIALNNFPINFNILLKTLNDSGYKISKPTLSAHLKHLLKHKAIKRKREGKQKITYSINSEKMENFQYHKDFSETIKNIIKNKETFDSYNISEKIRYISFVLTLIQVNLLKNEIRTVLEPERRFEATLSFLFIQSYLDNFRLYLLKTCVSSKEYAEKTLIEVEKFEEVLKKEIFERPK